ncbi:S-layer homology domain-containing protein [Salibacterium halotolerans]|uniref:S-layer homology domain-containing protein n=1 Tax=Salibacterium halotolerans TaxID=1884432 RepID=A0A1I5X5F4_9BACI|nr:S-layer homology domain-containing protein [Salibacterium halotolerans]SFQ27229.1 S-layer homology domain-containing protein [Salibacterium halotolerans]
MKKFYGIALSAALAASLTFPAAAGAQSSFSDIGEDFWAGDAISHLEEQGIISGYEDGTFGPNNEVTRGQAALMLASALDLDTSDRPDPGFSDIEDGTELSAAVAAVADEGIIEGYEEEFQPNEDLTRAQMSKVLAKAYDLSGDNSADFSDVSEDFWAYDHIDALASNGITTGYEDGSFKPGASTTRAQFATFLWNTTGESEQTPEAPETDEEITTVLEDVMETQQNLESYTFDGNIGINIDVPMGEQDLTEEEQQALEESMNMNMEMRGTFQKDPMITEVIVEQNIPQFDETMENVSLSTNEASYQYINDAAMMGYPEDWQDKYIEMNYEDILGGSSSDVPFDMEQQQEMAQEIYDVFIENFGTEYFELTESHASIPDSVEYDQVISFELTHDDLSDVMTILEEDVIPELEPILENPGAASALASVTGSSFQALNEDGTMTEGGMSEEDINQVLESLTLETFEMHQAINENNQVVYDTGEIEVSYTDEQQGEMSFGVDYGLTSSNFNEDVTFEYGLPESEENIITYDELMNWQEEQMQNFEEIEQGDLETVQ